MSEEIKFNLDEDIIMQIEMDSYMKYNDTIASMNDHLGEIYGYSDVKNVEEAQLHYEKELAYKAIKELQQKVEQLEKENKELKQQELCKTYDERLFSLKLRTEQLEKENKKLIVNCNIGNDNLTFYKKQWQQLENIRKEAIKRLSKDYENLPDIDEYYSTESQWHHYYFEKSEQDDYKIEETLSILNKGSDKE